MDTDTSVQDTLKRGFEQHQAGNMVGAEQCYRQVLRGNQRHGNALHLLGRLKFDAGLVELAIRLMRQAITCEPTNAAFQNNLGLVYVSLKNLDEARGCFSQAVRLKPDYAEAHNNLGGVLLELGQHAEAIACFEEAVRLIPDFAAARKNLEAALADQPKEAEVDNSLADHLARAMARWQINM